MRRLIFQIGDAEITVAKLTGRAALSELFRFEIEARAADDAPAPSDTIGKPGTLTVRDGFGHAYAVTGIITEARRNAAGAAAGTGSYVLEPAVAALAVGCDHRVFQDATAPEILKRVLDAACVPLPSVRFDLSAAYPKRTYTVQYGESDWAFIERLAREEGISYYFDHDEETTTLVFTDDSTVAPGIEGEATIPFHDADALLAPRDAVFHVRRATRAATSAVRLRDYNPEKPRLTLDTRAGDGVDEAYDAPGRFQVPAEGERLARVELEARRARRLTLTGRTSSTRLRAGRVFELVDHPVPACNSRLLVVEVTTEADLVTPGREELRLAWTAIPAATPFRAPRPPVTATPFGVQTAIVVGAAGEEIHTDERGRVRTQFYWDRQGQRDEAASTFMRVGQLPLGGAMVLPRVGWDVLVGHHEGDVDAPFVVSHLYDGRHPVPYPLPSMKTRTSWQTATTPGGASSNEIRFEDTKGSEEVFVNASQDANVVVGDNRSEVVGANHDVTIGGSHEVSVAANAQVQVGASQTVAIGASESLKIGGNREVKVGASESAMIGGSRSVTASGGLGLDVKGGRSLVVGGTMLAASAAEVSRSVLGSLAVTVGGAWVQAAGTGLANVTVGACAETVGGAKLCIGAAGCATTVKGACAETVGGAYVVAAGGNAGETATGTLAVTVGGAFVANAPSIEIEADTEIVLRCGASSITVTAGSIEVKSPTLASPGAMIDKGASQIHHN